MFIIACVSNFCRMLNILLFNVYLYHVSLNFIEYGTNCFKLELMHHSFCAVKFYVPFILSPLWKSFLPTVQCPKFKHIKGSLPKKSAHNKLRQLVVTEKQIAFVHIQSEKVNLTPVYLVLTFLPSTWCKGGGGGTQV